MTEQYKPHDFEDICEQRYGVRAGTFTLHTLPRLIRNVHDRQSWMGLALPVRQDLVQASDKELEILSLHSGLSLDGTVPVFGMDAIGAMMLDDRDRGMVHASGYSDVVLWFPNDIGDFAPLQPEI